MYGQGKQFPSMPQRLNQSKRASTMKKPLTAEQALHQCFTNEQDLKKYEASIEQKQDDTSYYQYVGEDGEVIEPDGAVGVALWDFNGERETDLSFSKGAMITIIQRFPNGWWEGELNGVIGDFPCNFVEIEEPQAVSSTTPKSARREAPTLNLNSSSTGVTSPPPKKLTTQTSSPALTPSAPRGLPMKEGFLTKKGHKRRNWKVRYFVLEPQKLSYFKAPGDFGACKKPKGSLVLDKATLVRIAPEMRRSNCFAVSSPFNQLLITAPTGEDMVKWMEKINEARQV